MQQQQQQITINKMTVIERVNRSIFQELEDFVRCYRAATSTVGELTVKSLERVIREHRQPIFVVKKEVRQWATMLRLPKEFLSAKRQLTFSVVKRDELAAQQIFVKVFARHMINENKPVLSVVLRLPTFTRVENMLLQLAKLKLTQEGALLVKIPMMQQQQQLTMIQEQPTEFGVIGQKQVVIERQLVKSTERTMFEELERLIREEMPMTLSTMDIEEIERQLLQRNNFFKREWVHCVRMPEYQPNELTFKVVRKSFENTLVKIFAQRAQQQRQTIVVRLPTAAWNCVEDLKKIRVTFTRDGLVLIRLPLENTGLYWENKVQRTISNLDAFKNAKLRRFVEQCPRSVFDELEELLIKEQQQIPRDITMLKRLLIERNNQLAQREWVTLVRLHKFQPHEVTFKVEPRTGCIKIYTRRQQFEGMRQRVIKEVRSIVQLPRFFEQRNLRVQFTREGLLLIRLPLINTFTETTNMFGDNNKIYYTTPSTWKLEQLRAVEHAKRTIFEELEKLICEELMLQTPCNIDMLEQVMRQHNNLFKKEFVSFVRLHKYQPNEVTYKLEKDFQGKLIVKIFAKKPEQWAVAEKVTFVVRLPTHLNEEQLIKKLRVIFTHDGLLVVRMPLVNMEECNTFNNMYYNNKTNCFEESRNKKIYKTIKQLVQCENERSIFEELKHIQQLPYDIAMLEKFLQQRNTQLTINQEWTKVVPLPQQSFTQQQQTVTFKVEKDCYGNTLVKIYTSKVHQYEQPELIRTIIVRLPTSLFDERELNQIRVARFTRENLLLIRVPILSIKKIEQELLLNNKCYEAYPIERSLTQELERILLKNNTFNATTVMVPQSIEQWERELAQRNNFLRDCEFTTFVRLQQRHQFTTLPQVFFKVEREMETGARIIKIVIKKQAEQQQDKVLVIRLPEMSGRFQLIEQELEKCVRVVLTADGHAIIRVFTTPRRFTTDDVWEQCEELRQARHTILREIMPRMLPFHVVPRFEKHCLTLDMKLPTQVSAEEFCVKTRDQLVSMEIKSPRCISNTLLKRFLEQARAICLPRVLAVSQMEVKLIGNRRCLRITLPIVQVQQHQQRNTINNTNQWFVNTTQQQLEQQMMRQQQQQQQLFTVQQQEQIVVPVIRNEF